MADVHGLSACLGVLACKCRDLAGATCGKTPAKSAMLSACCLLSAEKDSVLLQFQRVAGHVRPPWLWKHCGHVSCCQQPIVRLVLRVCG